MNLDEIEKKCFILALFIRDDKQRFLLGSGAYEFKEKQLHFAANVMSNDVVEVQGNDGYMLAGQVRRPTTQVFDGYIGDATVNKQDIEGYRRDFFGFFQKNHFYTVVYIFPDGSAIQRRRGFIVDSAEVKELWQLFPEYHIGMNFEDINYYKYSENEEGEETYGSSAEIALSTEISGGLIWENVSEIQVNQEGTELEFTGTINNRAVDYIDLYGNSEQKTLSGKNLLPNIGYGLNNGLTPATNSDGSITITGKATSTYANITTRPTIAGLPAGTYTFSLQENAPFRLNLAGTYSGESRATLGYITAGSKKITITTTGTLVELDLWATVSNGAEIDATIYPQFEAGSDATEFEPYCGGIPSPNPDYPQEIKTVAGEQTIKLEDATQGKNLWDPTPYKTGYVITASGEDYAFANGLQWQYTQVLPNTEYTISMTKGSETGNARIHAYTKEGVWIQQLGVITIDNENPSGSATFTTPGNIGILRWSWVIGGVNEQLELGSTATDYEPYTTQVYKIDLASKNLFDKDTAPEAYFYINGYNLTAWEARPVSTFIKIKPNTTYTITKPILTNNRFGVGTCVNYPTAGGTLTNSVQDNNTDNITITSGAQDNYLVVYFKQGADTTSNSIIFSQIQIEEGPAATTYEPYWAIELCKVGNYQDYIYIDDGDYYIHKEITKIAFDSTTSWTADSTSGMFHLNSATSSPQNADDKIVIISDQFTGVAANDRTSGLANMIYKFASSLYIRNTSFANTSAVVSHFTSNPAVAYYVMRTATDTQITNAGLIAQLEALNSATCYDGITWIKSEATEHNLPATMRAYITVNAGGGIEWDANGAVWEAGGGGNTTIMINSIENVYPVWTVVGPATNPVLTNLTTGTSISYSGSVSSSQTLVIDMLNQTAKLNGTSVIGNVAGEWLEFIPGNNTVSYSADNADAPNSTIEWQEVVG